MYCAENHGKVADFVKKTEVNCCCKGGASDGVTTDALARELYSIEMYGFLRSAIVRLETAELYVEVQRKLDGLTEETLSKSLETNPKIQWVLLPRAANGGYDLHTE